MKCPFLVGTALALVLGAQAGAQTPLTLQAAQDVAQQRSQALMAADAMAGAARERAAAAGQRPDPVLRFSLDNLPLNGPDRFSTTRDFMTQRSVSLMQTLPREAERQAAAARYGREAEVARAERTLRELALRREVALAWFERHAAEQQLALLQEQLEEAELQQRAAEAAFRANRGMQVEIFAARDALARLRQAALAADAAQANARRALARYTGLDAALPLAPAPPTTLAAHDTHRIAALIPRHPDLLLLDARTQQAEAEVEMARQDRQPDWSVELSFIQRGSAYSNMVSMAVSVPLPWDRPQRQDRELGARLAMREQLRAEREEMLREHLAQTESWQASWQAALSRLALLQDERLPLALQRTEAALAAYRGGSAPLSAVLEARRAELELRSERIQLELETARLWAQLDTLTPHGVMP